MYALGLPHRWQRLICLTANLCGLRHRAIFDVFANALHLVFRPATVEPLDFFPASYATLSASRLIVNGMPISSSNLSPSLSVRAVVPMTTWSPRIRSIEL